MDVLQQIDDLGILPVICPPTAELAVPLAKALTEGGIPAIEVTLRASWALDAIRNIRQACPEMIVGAGTVLNASQAAEAQAAGASFIVAPGFDPETVKACQERNLPIVPGCANPSEITRAVNMGLRTLKFFPAENLGGVAAIAALHGPFPECKFVPTGGLNLNNIGDYLDKPFISACGGSFLGKKEDILAENWDKITGLCRQCMDISLGFQLAHVGLNHPDEPAALNAANAFCRLFRVPLMKNKEKSVFNGTIVEQMKFQYFGEKGHIGFSTRSVKRALAWYRRNGVEIREETLKCNAAGNPEFFYLKEEIAGFALHITKR